VIDLLFDTTQGNEGSPGRVAMLIPAEENSEVWGVAFEIEDEDWEGEVREKLDGREMGGASRHLTRFYPQESAENADRVVTVSCYTFDKGHHQYAGPDTIENMANTILNSVGMSGSNLEYFEILLSSLRQLAPHSEDDHLNLLEEEIQKQRKAP